MESPDKLTLIWPTISKVIMGILGLVGLKFVYSVFAGSDGKKGMSYRDFQRFFSFFLFVGAFIFILKTEAERTSIEHKFGEMWFAMIITGLFSVLHMDQLLDRVTLLIEALVKLRSGRTVTEAIVNTQQTKLESTTTTSGSDETPR